MQSIHCYIIFHFKWKQTFVNNHLGNLDIVSSILFHVWYGSRNALISLFKLLCSTKWGLLCWVLYIRMRRMYYFCWVKLLVNFPLIPIIDRTQLCLHWIPANHLSPVLTERSLNLWLQYCLPPFLVPFTALLPSHNFIPCDYIQTH